MMNCRIDLGRSELAMNGGTPVRSAAWVDNYTLGEEEKVAAEYELDAAPVLDGMAAARGRLYVSTVFGKVVCFDGR